MRAAFCKLIAVIFLLSSNVLAVFGDNSNDWTVLFENSFDAGASRNFKGQVIKGKRTGMGLLKRKDKCLYVGDFLAGEMNGLGMIVAGANGEVKACPGAKVYVGRVKDGKKSGKGSCYAADGKHIYSGKFIDDQPVEAYPASAPLKSKCVAALRTKKNSIYFGETTKNKANGFGVIIFENGDVWLSNFINGKQDGIGVLILQDGEWETGNYVNGKYTAISQSSTYANSENAHRQRFRNNLSEAFSYFQKAATTTITMVKDIKGIDDVAATDDEAADETLDGDTRSKTSSSKKKTDKGEGKSNGAKISGTLYRSYDRAYGDYESQLARMKSDMERYYNDRDRCNIQEKMRDLRKKIIDGGYTRAKSPLEDWQP